MGRGSFPGIVRAENVLCERKAWGLQEGRSSSLCHGSFALLPSRRIECQQVPQRLLL